MQGELGVITCSLYDLQSTKLSFTASLLIELLTNWFARSTTCTYSFAYLRICLAAKLLTHSFSYSFLRLLTYFHHRSFAKHYSLLP